MSKRLSLADAKLAGRTGDGVRVVVLDSGVHASHPHVGSVAEQVCIEPPDGDAVDRLGHGTAVVAAIRDIAPGAEIVVGKIFDRTLSTNAEVLARAIEWATSRGARVINLSLGTTNPEREKVLRQSVADAVAAGAVVVAAREANGVQCLPGGLAMAGVVPVAANPALERDEFVVDDGVIFAAPYPRSIPGVPKERNLAGVSFAVANVSGLVARLLQGQSGGVPLADLFSVD